MPRELVMSLSPEARAEGQKVAAEIRVESTRLLAGSDEVTRTNPKNGFNIIISGKNIQDKTIFAGADLGISRHSVYHYPGSSSEATVQELYNFYPDHVSKITRSGQYSGGKRCLPSCEADIHSGEGSETSVDDLRALLNDLRTSIPFASQFPSRNPNIKASSVK